MIRHYFVRQGVYISAAACVLLIAACGAGSHRTGTKGPPSPTRTAGVITPGSSMSTPAPSATAPVEMLPGGQVGQRGDIPWSLVGAGWMLTAWASVPYQGPAPHANPAGTTLFLVDPLGGRYVVATGTAVPEGYLLRWSGDATRAFFEPYSQGSASILNLVTGTVTKVSLPGFTNAVFTRPIGLALITAGLLQGDGTVNPAQRFDLNGALQLTFPTTFPEAGSIVDVVPFSRMDGTQLVFTTRQGFELVNNEGQPLTYIPTGPSGLSPEGPIGLCQPVSWWMAAEMLVSCEINPPQLWLVPIDGSPPSRLAPAGYDDAWRTSTGDYLQRTGCKPALCLAKLSQGGTATPVTVPPQFSQAEVRGAYENQLAVLQLPSGATGGYLDWFDPATHSVTALLGGSVNGGSVNAVLMQQPSVPAP